MKAIWISNFDLFLLPFNVRQARATLYLWWSQLMKPESWFFNQSPVVTTSTKLTNVSWGVIGIIFVVIRRTVLVKEAFYSTTLRVHGGKVSINAVRGNMVLDAAWGKAWTKCWKNCEQNCQATKNTSPITLRSERRKLDRNHLLFYKLTFILVFVVFEVLTFC